MLRLTLSGRRPLSYRNQSINLQSKSMKWFLYDDDLRHERVKLKLRFHGNNLVSSKTENNENSNLKNKQNLNPLSEVKNLRLKNVNKTIKGEININSISSKFNQLSKLVLKRWYVKLSLMKHSRIVNFIWDRIQQEWKFLEILNILFQIWYKMSVFCG